MRRNYYLANIEEKRRASREYARKKREQFKKYERARSAFVNTSVHHVGPDNKASWVGVLVTVAGG